MGKPGNLKFGLSMSRINKLDTNMAKWILTGFIDFLFVVTDSDEIRDELLDMPFSRPCMCEEYSYFSLCKGCYMPEMDIVKNAGIPVMTVERLRK